MNISRFSHIYALGIKFDLEVGQGQPRFIICANLIGSMHPHCYRPSPKAIGLLVPEKKIFKGFLPYMGVVVILVM